MTRCKINIIGLDAVNHIYDIIYRDVELGKKDFTLEEAMRRIECSERDLRQALNELTEAAEEALAKLDSEEKESVNKESSAKEPWTPTDGETYYYIETVWGGIGHAVWRNGKLDRMRYRLHDVFESVEAAYHYMETVEDDG